ncbi:MAG: [FeFe] hydrogenase, group A [Lachnospiraceae bacterium]
MVSIIIDNREISVPEGTTIMEAAKSVKIEIPKLCFLKEINEIAACRVCVVEVEGQERLITSCNNAVKEGMVIYTNSPKVRKNRQRTVELLLSQHRTSCTTCKRSGNCSLQDISTDLNIGELPYENTYEKFIWNTRFPLVRDASKCIKCMRCIQVCSKIQDLSVWDLESTGSRTTVGVSYNKKIEESNCSLCGQCITHCPVGALSERDDTRKVFDAIADKKKVTVAQIAPAVRAAWAEELGLKDAPVGKIVDALKRMGIDYVFDTSFTADLTIMEEATEFVEKFTSGELAKHPMFTSCCPAWVRFISSEFPRMKHMLSSAKSPQQMFGAMIKTYFAEQIQVDPENIYSVSVMPCLAKKDECEKDLYYGEYAGKEVDTVITTRELLRMMRSEHIAVDTLKDVPCSAILQEKTGAGVIFGVTGGVMEAALRTAYYMITGENPNADAFRLVRRADEHVGVTSATLDILGNEVRIAAVSGLGNARKLLEKIQSGEEQYHFVEVMACPGGCVGGGGQPIHEGEELAFKRGKQLYSLDQQDSIRFSHENSDVIKLYADFLEKPGSHKAHALLHTKH